MSHLTSRNPFPQPSTLSTRLVGLSLLIFFVTLYSLVYSGTFITDDEHVLAARSLSFAFDDQFNLSRVIGNSRVYDFPLYGPIGATEAANVEPAQAVLGAILAKISVWLGIGRIQTMFLLNIWVTAFTAVIIFITAIKMGNSKQLGIILSVLFGLCTIAFPYSRTYFRDPLAMLFLSGAWLFLHQIIQQSETKKNSFSRVYIWLGFFGCLIAGILSKNTIAIAIPVFLIEINRWDLL